MRLTPGRLVVVGLLLLVAVAGALWLIPSDDYIFLPDRPKALEPLVRVEGESPQRGPGGIYLVDVLVRRASLLESLVPGIRDGSTLRPESAVTPPGVSETQRRRADRQAMARSQQVGAAVALRALGYDIDARPTGVLVEAVDPDSGAAGKVELGDVITAVNGIPVRTTRALRRQMAAEEPGATVVLTLRNGRAVHRVRVQTTADPRRPGRALIGVVPGQAASIRLPIRITIDTGEIGGPSAGLAFALDVMEELGRDVDRGRKVAATGQLELDGTVVPVGGLKQKTIGARESGIDVLLVPVDNAAEARRYAGGVRVVAVRTFGEALRRLATAPASG